MKAVAVENFVQSAWKQALPLGDAFPGQLEPARALGLFHLLSLDAPTVAVVWSLAFAWAVRARLPEWLPVLVALVTWTVYVADRLLDARSAMRRGEPGRLRQRHLFHWRHRRAFVPFAAAAAGVAAWLALRFLPLAAWRRDSLLALAALLYLAAVHLGRRLPPSLAAPLSVRFPVKELFVGLLFTAGCVLAGWSRVHAPPGILSFPVGCQAAYFAALGCLNCRAIENWESSMALAPLAPHALLLAGAGLPLATFLLSVQPRAAALILAGAVSALLLALLDNRRGRLTPLTLRVAADLVLLVPVLLLPLGGWTQ